MSTIHLSNGVWTLDVSDRGQILTLRNASMTFGALSADPALCEVGRGDQRHAVTVHAARLIRHSGSAAEFETSVDIGVPAMLRFMIGIADQDDTGTAVTCRLALEADRPPGADVRLRWFWNQRNPSRNTRLFAPLFDGRGLRTTRAHGHTWEYRCAGYGGEGERLALPLIDECPAAGGVHVAYVADPFFSTGMSLPRDGSPDLFECTFLAAAGADQFKERTFGITLHPCDTDSALQGFFRHMLPNSPPGSAWLHEIAMVHYDYFSEKGEGWFRDIDRLADLVPQQDRAKVVLTLHGWYDLLGRYCYNETSRSLDDRWTVMPRGDPRENTLQDIHRRLTYAKERGFRVLLYYADGMAIDAGAPNFREELVFHEPDGGLRKHHWGGPDTIGQTYVMDPLHPRVPEFFRGYTDALLREFGGEIDGLVWDETFTTRIGDISRGEFSGYADRAFMMLAAELRGRIKTKYPEMVLLASDAVGLALPQGADGTYWRALPAQNALVFDGTYQDSQCYPAAWQYGLFPNYRNVLWSCNWRPVENFEWTVLGVTAFGSPVAISNGWGEDRGVSQYSETEVKKLLELFAYRKDHPARVRWIECAEADLG